MSEPAPPNPLDPLALELHGRVLIEASAGTGKTWTVAALFLRLVLGHGVVAGRRGFAPEEILVMSFTRAATQELASRIRERLVQASVWLRETPAPAGAPAGVAAADPFLEQLRASLPDAAARDAAAARAEAAARAMDSAAVLTLDAWCQRVLREHALASGAPFDEELLPDESQLLERALQDFWRAEVCTLDDAAAAPLREAWPDLAAFEAELRPLLRIDVPAPSGPDPAPARPASLAACVAAERELHRERLAALHAGWPQRVAAMRAWIARHRAAFVASRMTEKNTSRWLDALAAWAEEPAAAGFDIGTGAERFTPAGLRAAALDPGALEVPGVFAEFEALQQALRELPPPQAGLRQHALHGVRERLAALKAGAGLAGHADFVARLDAALDPARGTDADALRLQILGRTPLALVDEFQDTDPRLLRILDRIWRIDAEDRETLLVLIGDPKQAIYGFRGADIHAYLAARRRITARRHVLLHNRRSVRPLVRAVNRLFELADAAAAEGVFGYGRDRLPFDAVMAAGRRERLLLEGEPVAALTVSFEPAAPAPRGVGVWRALAAGHCAARIAALLRAPGAGFEQPGSDGGTRFTRLAASDIAVLVRSAKEAAAIRRALRARRVSSVYLSDRESVFESAEAAEVLRLLQAIATPEDPRRVRAALASALLALEPGELCAMADDDSAFEAARDRLAALHDVWQRQGVLAALRGALHRFGVPARLLAGGDGERRLTNVLHLAELLQAESPHQSGPAALLRWLAGEIDEARGGAGPGGDDERVLRLESDAGVVQVVTVHKSKGLEYPLVFLPFAAVPPSRQRRGAVFAWLRGADGERLGLDLAPGKAALAAEAEEAAREEMRLLYVALTRARHALWLAAAPVSSGRAPAWHRSPLGRLVTGHERCEAPAIEAALIALAACSEGAIVLEHLDPDELPALTPAPAPAVERPLLPAAPYAGRFDRGFSLLSYSALVRGMDGAAAAAAAAAPGGMPADPPADDPGASPAPGTPGPIPLQPAVQAADPLADPLAGIETELPPDVRGAVLRADDEPALPPPAWGLSPGAGEAAAAWHAFPRGAWPGTFLHGLLEWLAGEAYSLHDSPALQAQLRRRCEQQGHGARAGEVLQWMLALVSSPLPPLGGATLAQLRGVRAELEFWLPLPGLQTTALDTLCHRHLLPGRARPPLPPRQPHGLLMGFADLVFEHEGRFWVLDHKSNALHEPGRGGDEAYHPAALEQAVLQHRYDVQAALYLLALHRLLRQRLGARYEPARQLGGAIFHFLRGVSAPGAGCLYLVPSAALLQGLEALVGTPATGPA